MDWIFGWDTLRYRRQLEVYRSKDIEVPEHLTILHGLPEDVNVVTHKLGRGVYVNRIDCSILPSPDCDIFKSLPSRNKGTSEWHTTKKSAKDEALRLEDEVVKLIDESNNKTYTISAREAGVPMYFIHQSQVGDYFTLVAGEIDPSGELDARGGSLGVEPVGRFPITSMTELGQQKKFYPYGGPAGVLRFNVEDIHPLIHEVEEYYSAMYTAVDGFFINAFSFGNWTGYRKGEWLDHFETPIRFYKIEVDRDNPIGK